MTALAHAVIEKTADRGIKFTYVDRALTRWWNERRQKDDTALFTGFYWSKGNEQAGPFKTRSACIRDAYYRFVLQREPPTPALRRHEKVTLRVVGGRAA